jgi:hypothetical protein
VQHLGGLVEGQLLERRQPAEKTLDELIQESLTEQAEPTANVLPQQRAKDLAMENSHPAKCVAAVQRPLKLFEVSEIVQSTRAKLVLPEQTA